MTDASVPNSPGMLASDVSQLTARQLAGQLMVVGFEGKRRAPDSLLASIQARERAGVVLFRRNVGKGLDGLHAVAQLNQSLITACPPGFAPLIAVDEEGGRVARLCEPALKMPPMRTVAKHGGADLVQRIARVVGQQLAALGFSMNFAPVVDVDTNVDNPIVGDRAFSRHAESVVILAEAYRRGLTAGGVQHCLKHFPGHGDTLLDSHLALPRVEHGRQRLDAIELLPFRRMVKDADSVMTAHVVFPALAPEDNAATRELPATLRRRLVRDLLREQFGFEGLVFSDDLEMRALAEQGPAGPLGVRAIEAGCDILLVCSDIVMQEEVFTALISAIEKTPDFRATAEAAAIRSLALRRKITPQSASPQQLRQLLKEEVQPLQEELNELL